MEDHDQRFKFLLDEFLGEFLRFALPADWGSLFDVSKAHWEPQETFLDPPKGKTRSVDLIVRVPTFEPIVLVEGDPTEQFVVLIHIEIESGESSQPIRPRMAEYYPAMRRRFQIPVLPIVLLLKVGLDGIGWQEYRETFRGVTLLTTQYRYIGLPALNGVEYLEGENLLGVALASLMRLPEDRRAELKVEAMRRVAGSGENDVRKYLLAEAIEAYFPLDEEQAKTYQVFAESDEMQEIRVLKNPWTDRARVDGNRTVVRLLLEKKFGPLSESAQNKLEAADEEELLTLAANLLDATSLTDLGLT